MALNKALFITLLIDICALSERKMKYKFDTHPGSSPSQCVQIQLPESMCLVMKRNRLYLSSMLSYDGKPSSQRMS